MKIFELGSNGVPVVTVECLLIPEFANVYNRDTTKTKDKAFKDMQYIYFHTNPKSLYTAYDSSIREERLKEDTYGDSKYKIDLPIKKACEKYKEFLDTPSLKFLDSCIFAMESMKAYFNKVDWGKMDMNGKPLYKIQEVSKAIKDAPGIIDTIEKLKEKVAKETNNQIKVRGGSGNTGGDMEFE
jgi:hypothetical protein